jgi:hypothetical protein
MATPPDCNDGNDGDESSTVAPAETALVEMMKNQSLQDQPQQHLVQRDTLAVGDGKKKHTFWDTQVRTFIDSFHYIVLRSPWNLFVLTRNFSFFLAHGSRWTP